MKLREIEAMDNETLLQVFYLTGIKVADEVNSKRGLSKRTVTRETRIINELAKRFNVDAEILKNKIGN